MAEEASATETLEIITETETDKPSTQDTMELENPTAAAEETPGDADGSSKRARDEVAEAEAEDEAAKKQKVEKSAAGEEDELVKADEEGEKETGPVSVGPKEDELVKADEEGEKETGPVSVGPKEDELVKAEEEGEKETGPVSVGPKSFGSSVEMFDYFYKFLHYWPPNLNVNKYEHTVLLDLLKKGHLEPEKKIGDGILAFQVRYHPHWKNRCFFLIRNDESVNDFSFRKCVDHILPLPENMKIKSDVNKALGGGGHRGKGGGGSGSGGGGGRGGWRGRGRGRGRGGDKSRN